MAGHATSEIASGSKSGLGATEELSGEDFRRPWLPLIKMDAAVTDRINAWFAKVC